MIHESDRVLFEHAGEIAIVRLNRPEKLNALDREMLAALESIFAELDRDMDIRVVILTGAGERAFSVGADIKVWSELEPLDMWRRWVRDGHRIFSAIAQLRQPVIAAVNGYALGGGLELALAADIRIALRSARFAAPEVKIGTLPGWAGTKHLVDLVGPGRARHLILTGQQIDAETAERWGLVSQIVPDDELMERATELAKDIATNSPVAVQLAKQVLSGFNSDSGVTALEAIAGALAATTDDGREGIAAFKEKRPPRFSGA
jgi:enoyl-CoA hydratase